MAVEVKVNTDAIQSSVTTLRDIADRLGSRSLNVSFAVSKGDAVDELQQMAEQLRAFGSALALLVNETADKLEAGGEAFKEMESQSQAMFEQIAAAAQKWIGG